MAIGFNFDHFGNTYNTVRASTSGLLEFGSSSTATANATIPVVSAPNDFAAPFWDDLTVSSAQDLVGATLGTAPNRRFVAQWTNARLTAGAAAVTFEAILFETGGMSFRYGTMGESGASATIGVEDATGTVGVLHSYNAPAVTSGRSLRLGCGLGTARASHSATLLTDGRVLAVGGAAAPSAELYSRGGGWTPTGVPAAARRLHTATLLPSGRVFVAGGLSGASPVGTTELFDPATGSFAPGAALGSARRSHTAVLLANGTVLLTGGMSDASSYLATSEIYDPVAGTLAPTGSLLTARASHTASLLAGGEVLVCGGLNQTGDLAACERYDPRTGNWTAAGGLGTARRAHTATVLPSGFVLFAGGRTASTVIASAELYDPGSGTSSPTAALIHARESHSATLLPWGGVAVAGGSDGTTPLASVEVYDPRWVTWAASGVSTSVPALAQARHSHTATLLDDGSLLVAAGMGASNPLSTHELLTIAPAGFSAAASMSSPRGEFSATTLLDGRVLVAGGWSGSARLLTAELFDPATATWSPTGSMAGARNKHTATLLADGTVLVAGGEGSLGTVERYSPSSGTWSSAAALPVGVEQHCATLLGDGRVLVTGGVAGSSSRSDAQLYDPQQNAWSLTNMIDYRDRHTCTLLRDGRVLIAGGYEVYGARQQAELFDPRSGTFAATGLLTRGRLAHAAALLPDGRVLVAGGGVGFDAGNTTATVEIFDPGSGVWQAAASLRYARRQMEALVLADGSVFLAAGSGGAGTAEAFDARSGIWTQVGLVSDRWLHKTVLLADGRALVAGGYGSGTLALASVLGPAPAASPRIATVTPPSPAPGQAITILGTGFRGRSPGGSGTVQDSPAGQPVVWLGPLGSGAANTSYRSAPASPIGDFTTTTFPLVVAGGGTLVDVDVGVTLTHSYDGDLAISLRHPDGTTVELVNRRGGAGDNFTATTFDDGAGTAIASGVAPFSGSYRPESPLTALAGKPANGTWLLVVRDASERDVGRLASWQLGLRTGPLEPTYLQGSAFGPTTLDAVLPLGLAPGSYRLGLAVNGVRTEYPLQVALGACFGGPGSACNDGNSQTQSDRCTALGSCVGTPYVCSPTQCQTASTQDGRGGCVVASVIDGTSCAADADLCTLDTCQAGACTPGPYKTCSAPAPAACSADFATSYVYDAAGTCDPATGNCNYHRNTIACSSCADICDAGSGRCTLSQCCNVLCNTPPNAQCYLPSGACAAGQCSYTPRAVGTGCDDGNPCTASDACNVQGRCVGTLLPNGSACSDGNACTGADSCQAGLCAPGAPLVCAASDQCHSAGTCNPASGCSNPQLADGTTCSDGNACTRTDTCQAGVCTGGNALACSASDQCHDVGTCDTTTGACSNPPKARGAACNDGAAATRNDQCDGSGVCAGTPYTCTPTQCETSSVPNGVDCTITNKALGAACDDGLATTRADQCNGSGSCAGTAYACTPTQCQATSVPNGVDCTITNRAAGSTCNDGLSTTRSDQCDGTGICAGTAYVCTATQCQATSVANGTDCTIVNKAAGASCNDGLATTRSDQCDGSGTCAGTTYACTPAQCETSSVPNGSDCTITNKALGAACDDGLSTTRADQCNGSGSCAGTAYTCTPTQCQATSVPNGVDCTITNRALGAACNDGLATTRNDQCDGTGVCAGTAYVCTATQCQATSVPNGLDCTITNKALGAACNDGLATTRSDQCDGTGVCAGTAFSCAPTQCQAASTANGADCTVVNKAAGASCNDGLATTRNDQCDGSGACAGTAYTCAPTQCENASVENGVDCTVTGKAAGTVCNDANPATRNDRCDGSGACVGTPFTCAPTSCQVSSVPNGSDCTVANKADGAACNDGNACTAADTCLAGVCTGMSPAVCRASDQCHLAGTCDRTTGQCSNPTKADGSTCDDGQACTTGDVCGAGVCLGTPKSCDDGNPCTQDACERTTGACVATPTPAGTACSDGNLCTARDACDGAGRCVGSAMTCTTPPNPQCYETAGTCLPATGTCSYAPKADSTACDDGNRCTTRDACERGSCIGHGPPPAETCNGEDDDCDGIRDNGFDVGVECQAGAGACERSGHKVCLADGTGTQCDATPGTPTSERCDGIDNDCDGTVDNGFRVGEACMVGVGACRREGRTGCEPDGRDTRCLATAGMPVAEICGNGLDDDCDGRVDNGCADGGASGSGDTEGGAGTAPDAAPGAGGSGGGGMGASGSPEGGGPRERSMSAKSGCATGTDASSSGTGWLFILALVLGFRRSSRDDRGSQRRPHGAPLPCAQPESEITLRRADANTRTVLMAPPGWRGLPVSVLMLVLCTCGCVSYGGITKERHRHCLRRGPDQLSHLRRFLGQALPGAEAGEGLLGAAWAALVCEELLVRNGALPVGPGSEADAIPGTATHALGESRIISETRVRFIKPCATNERDLVTWFGDRFRRGILDGVTTLHWTDAGSELLVTLNANHFVTHVLLNAGPGSTIDTKDVCSPGASPVNPAAAGERDTRPQKDAGCQEGRCASTCMSPRLGSEVVIS